MENFVGDLTGAAIQIFTTDDTIRLAIMLVLALLGGLVMQGYGQILSTTVIVLILLVVADAARAVFMDGVAFEEQLDASYAAFQGLSAFDLVAYFVSFFVVITVVYIVKSMLSRG
jgi:hypothetical protein